MKKYVVSIPLLVIAFVLCTVAVLAQGTNPIFQGKPVINGADIIGQYPNTAFLYTIPTSGERPIQWRVNGLPQGLKLDDHGVITGVVKVKGSYKLKITANNKLGKYCKSITLKVGDTLALTPPMGWNSWNTFTNSVNEKLIKEIADYMVSSGMRELGYQYINIDDFWQLKSRDRAGNIQINKEKFPNGLKALSKYIHSKGLKIGIYSDAADRTCGGVAGSLGYEQRDAQLFADWGIDLLKYDYCNAPNERDTAILRYTSMSKALRSTNRSIYFSICEWGERKPWEWAGAIGGDSWRTTHDIFDIWDFNKGHNGILQIITVNSKLSSFAKRGRWNDPDMLIVGIGGKGMATSGGEMKAIAKGLSHEEYRTHMSIWCLMAAPLLCGNDLRNMDAFTQEVLFNKEIIAINQDSLGIQAEVLKEDNKEMVFVKRLTGDRWAIGLFNKEGNTSNLLSLDLNILGISEEIEVRNVWTHQNLGTYKGKISFNVPAHGCQVFVLSKKNELSL